MTDEPQPDDLRPPGGYISQEIARFRTTRRPRHLWRAMSLVLRHGRTLELVAGLYALAMHRPPPAPAGATAATVALSDWGRQRLTGLDVWPRDAIATALSARRLAGHLLPEDFAGARREAVALGPGWAVVGEYGHGRRRLCLVTPRDCTTAGRYAGDPGVRHVHAVFPIDDVQCLVTTGDRARYRDRWCVDGDRLVFQRRERRSMAGHTAMARVGDRLVMGSDLSSRPNFLELDDGRRFLVPRPASPMYAVAFAVPDSRHLVTLHKRLDVFGGDTMVSVFDVQTGRYLTCVPGPDAQAAAAPMPLRDD